MCVKPNFYTTTSCKDCDHRVNTHHKSDVLHLPFQCEKCGSQNLEYQHHEYRPLKIPSFLRRLFLEKIVI